MLDNVVLIAYSEIGLKSPPVRRRLENQLMSHIRKELKLKHDRDYTVRRIQGRIIIEGDDHLKIAQTAMKVFGVAAAMPAIRLTDDLKTIVKVVADVAERIIKPNQSFAIKARRTGKQLYSSKDIEIAAGAEVLKRLSVKGIYVNLSNPQITIHVEARGKKAYVYHHICRGFAGLPYGSQGKVIVLFSGGIDSPVAAWFIMRRGCSVRLVFFDQRPFVGDDYYERALNVARRLKDYVPLDDFVVNIVPMGKIMEAIVHKVPARLICLICKRIMYRFGSLLAEQIGAEGLVTGESIGQVASQTLYNLRVIDEASSFPVYRPLIGFEKLESIQWAKKIGTYQVSTTSIHGCTAVPKKPSTRAHKAEVYKAEQKLNIQDLLLQALKELTIAAL